MLRRGILMGRHGLSSVYDFGLCLRRLVGAEYDLDEEL